MSKFTADEAYVINSFISSHAGKLISNPDFCGEVKGALRISKCHIVNAKPTEGEIEFGLVFEDGRKMTAIINLTISLMTEERFLTGAEWKARPKAR
ncbi:MAG: hypothetical protein AAF565_01740 [Pseudomonadota bacterium]